MDMDLAFLIVCVIVLLIFNPKELIIVLCIIGFLIIAFFLLSIWLDKRKKKNISSNELKQNTIENTDQPIQDCKYSVEANEEYKNALKNELSRINATLDSENYKITITTNSNVDLDKLLSYTDTIDFKRFGIEYGSRLVDFVILNESTKELLYIKFDEVFSTKHEFRFSCYIAFSDASKQSKVFRGKTLKDCIESSKPFISCYLNNILLKREYNLWDNILIHSLEKSKRPTSKNPNIEEWAKEILSKSNYYNLFRKEIYTAFENGILIVDYLLPSIDGFYEIKEYKYIAKTNTCITVKYPYSFISNTYERVIYSICLRTLYELFYANINSDLQSIVFNGHVRVMNKAVGHIEDKYIVSIHVSKLKFSQINVANVDPKICFKTLKGVSGAKLIDISAVVPVIQIDKNDKRIVEGNHINVDQGTNLASMDWMDFEHFVRELFELEFSQSGGEVRVTQASRDGGVDAIIFDPDPIRGGKIIIQAKRYTNTVGVSAVRDLYGTVIHEGANCGILITTSDYGSDSYEYAKDKPLKLLNGQHLLGLLQKHGKQARINIQEAKLNSK